MKNISLTDNLKLETRSVEHQQLRAIRHALMHALWLNPRWWLQ